MVGVPSFMKIDAAFLALAAGGGKKGASLLSAKPSQPGFLGEIADSGYN